MWLFLVGGLVTGDMRGSWVIDLIGLHQAEFSVATHGEASEQPQWLQSNGFDVTLLLSDCLSLTLGPCSQAFWRLPTDLIVRTRAVWAKHSSSHVLINELLSSGSKLAWGVAHSVGWSVATGSCKLKGECWQDARCSLNASPGLVFVFFCKRHSKLDANS